jgi:predicted enzyme related to lactoylglutathione lyase
MAPSPYEPGTFCWFDCGTTDAAKAKSFYVGVFGWEAMDAPMHEGGGPYTIFKLGEAEVAGLYALSGPEFAGVPSHWMTYVSVADIRESTARARTLGGHVMADSVEVPGVGSLSVVCDPTGAMFSMMQLKDYAGRTPLGMAAGGFGWSELVTRDTARAKAFYMELFDWKAKTDDNPAMPYTEFQVGGTSVAGMMEMTPQHGDAPPHWLPYVMVDDCDATADEVKQHGGQVLVPPTSIPQVGRFSVFMDPTGAVLAVIKLEERS